VKRRANAWYSSNIDLRRLKPLKTAWIDELGDPDKPEDWAYLSTMLP
jgi:prolyl oligopeptidase PreP (S9A serine peptidase family)